jgi:hypothetical protein
MVRSSAKHLRPRPFSNWRRFCIALIPPFQSKTERIPVGAKDIEVLGERSNFKHPIA